MTDYNRIRRESANRIDAANRDVYICLSDTIDEVLNEALRETHPPQVVQTLAKVADKLRDKAWGE